jgi:uncharacterized protein (DUF1778 family)
MPRTAVTAEVSQRRARSKRHESLPLSERDRAVFFDALIRAPKPNARLRRAFRSAEARVIFSRLDAQPTGS